MSTPVERITRLLNEGAIFMVQVPGQMSIDLTPDVIAAMDEKSITSRPNPEQLTREPERKP